jgi:hypothetical protein
MTHNPRRSPDQELALRAAMRSDASLCRERERIHREWISRRGKILSADQVNIPSRRFADEHPFNSTWNIGRR